MTTPAILAYVRTGSISTASPGISANPDYTNNLVYLSFDGNSTSSGYAKFNGYSDDSDLLEKNASQMPSVPNLNTPLPGQTALASGYLISIDTQNTLPTFWSVRATDLSYTAQLAGVGGDPESLPYVMFPATISGTHYIIDCPQTTSIGKSHVAAMPVGSLTSKTIVGTVDEHKATGCPGASGSAFVLGIPDTSTAAFGFYKVGSGLSWTKIGTVTPAQIDATWTHIITSAGLAYDATDGNLLWFVQTTDAVTHQTYLVKINATTAAVMWTLPVVGLPLDGDYHMWKNNITASKMYFLSGATFYTINTSAGTATTQTIGTLTLGAGQMSDDVSDSLILRGAWSETTTHPTYLGTYMGTGGHHAITDNWMRFFPNGVPPAPPPPPPPPPPFPIVSVNRAWTYTMDGHTFYVLDLGVEGTFVYDLDTKQWSQFQTNGANWAMTNGCMFGDRVVAGDTATTDVWELVPSAVKDSGASAFEITHIATGGVALRTRTYISCAALRVAASFGQLDDVAGVNMTLDYSDDQGQTWTTPAPIALTEGTYSQEIAWRSLGSFAAPGRIFRLTDSGGVIRIDGVDAMLDDFDDEKQPAEQE